jgi:hypothetical protein
MHDPITFILSTIALGVMHRSANVPLAELTSGVLAKDYEKKSFMSLQRFYLLLGILRRKERIT